MSFEVIKGKSWSEDTDSLVYFCYQASSSRNSAPQGTFLKALDHASDGAVSDIFSSGEFSGELNSSALLRRPKGWGAGNVILAGLGKKNSAPEDQFRQSAGTISRLKVIRKSDSILFDGDGKATDKISSAIVEGFELGRWKMLDYKTNDDSAEAVEPDCAIVVSDSASLSRARKGISSGRISSEAVDLCRRLSFHPANVITPETLAAEAKRQGRLSGFKTRVFDVKRMEKERMGALLAVGRGSHNPSRFIIMEYNGAAKSQRPVVLVGKGITFDTGGISLKPGLNMHEMKGDMTGSAVVISVMTAIAKLKLKLNVVGLVPSAENMPSDRAYKPGDIITARNGKTIEIINTDAEGRLVLADALDYANVFKPQAVIDVATLTGATLFILGYSGAPFVSTNRAIARRLMSASNSTAERLWELPLWPDFTERMRSKIADLVNSGGRPAGTLTAAAFLKEFIGDYPWAHIDIAYVDLEPSGQPYTPVGPSGFGVRLLIDLLTNWKTL